MKRYLIYIILLALTPVFTSCEDWFDVQPKSQVKSDDLLDGEDGFKRALIGVYTLMADNASYGAQGTMAFTEVLGGAYTSVKMTDNNFNSASRYDYNRNVGIINGLWAKNYNAIANLNNILENIEGKQEMFSEGNYEIIKGEALALRAFIHFDLLRNFAPAPIVGLDEPAIPYVDMVGTAPVPQLTVNQVIERVITELKAAADCLEDYDPIGPAFDTYEESRIGQTFVEDVYRSESFLMFRKERLNYYAVLGALARVHMYRGNEDDKTEAYKYANDVINSGRFMLNDASEVAAATSSQTAMTYMAQEYVFSLYKRDLYEAVNEKYFYFNNNDDRNYSELLIDEQRRNECFEVEEFGGVADIRLNKLFAINRDGLSYYLAKYNYGGMNVNRVPLLKVSEMYLIIAEAVERWDVLDYLRKKRGLKGYPVGVALGSEIEKEYRKEFLGEGQMFYYYKRINKLINENMSDYGMFILPIPDAELERGIIK